MKIKFLTTLSLSSFLFLVGCGGGASNNANNSNNANMNKSNNAVVTQATVAPAADPVVKAAVEDAMKKKNFTDVTVDATTTGVTLRGSVPKGKMAEAVQAAQEAGKKPVKNELTEK